MRPSLLDPLFKPIISLPGVGPKVAELIARVAGRESGDDTRALDLIGLLPHAIIDRRNRPGIANTQEGIIATLPVHVDRHQPSPRGRKNVPYRVSVHDETGEMTLTFFHAREAWLQKLLPVGENVIVSGKVEWFNGRPSMIHPDHVVLERNADELPLVEPVYPLTAGLSPKTLRKAVDTALGLIPDLPEWIDHTLLERYHFRSFKTSLLAMHHVEDAKSIDLDTNDRRRLAYDELLAGQISLALVRQRLRRLPGEPIKSDGHLRAQVLQSLPYSLTNSQFSAVSDILQDIAGDMRMLRLLQGDVGSGKTVVAMMAMTAAVEAGGQAVIMAPTEILSRQHFSSIAEMAKSAGMNVQLLTGRHKGEQRREILSQIESGEAQIIVGTHALFQESVVYKDLRLAVVDEQHRFGVHQRLRLTAKGNAPHMLVMTATPIPRTLVLAAFGDMDVSKLTEKPAGRKPIQTVAVPDERIGDIIDRLRAAIADGRKAYWICPLVEDSELSDLMSAEQRFEHLNKVFGDQVGLVHGRMSSSEKDAAMTDFKDSVTKILVATTVVEVGVDVPDASIMVIEHAERFGLSQLHQLRGRVGRGEEASSCILLYKGPLGETATSRLKVMRETEDGFVIAEEDLRLRGEGEVLGTRQSGTPGFRFASLEAHGDILEVARQDARYIIETDPDLSSDRGNAIRTLLYVFRRDEAIRFLRAG